MNRIILVTGGTKGIGKAIIEVFAANGFDIITCARNQEELDHLKNEIESQFPSVAVSAFKADLSVAQERNNFIAAVLLLAKPIAVLVNNTGIFVPGSVFSESEGQLEKMINTNLYSAYHVTRAIIPAMQEAHAGSIFNICSTASIIPYVNGGSYCISKFALYGMSKVLREEMKPYNIKVTAVLPGATLTSSWDGTTEPSERFIQPNDVASAIWGIYQLSPGADVEEILIRPQLGDL